MISLLEIRNFKPFQFQRLTFKPLTLLCGLNSTGKSSVLQALLLLRQSYQTGLLEEKRLTLDGNLVNLGTVKDVICEDSKEDYLGFLLEYENRDSNQKYRGEWRFECDNIEDIEKKSKIMSLYSKSSTRIDEEIYKSSLFDQNSFTYIQADRIAPRPFFEMPTFTIQDPGKLGSRGEYSAFFLNANARTIKICNSKLSHPNVKKSQVNPEDIPEPSLDLIDQVEAWMSEISPRISVNTELNPALDLVKLQYKYQDSNLYRTTNIGFGVTYILPILVAILSGRPDHLILLENPEAHLHPKGQSRIGQLLALAASCGLQIIVETHSDHILNGIRLAVHRGDLNSDDVAIHYFQREEDNGIIQSKVISPRMYPSGGIDRWPDGFFDQAEKDLMELL